MTGKIHWAEIVRDLESVLPEYNMPVPGLERKDRRFSNLTRDIRYALRMLARNEGFAATAILTIALGIGPNTAIFSMLYAVFWAPTGIPNGDRVAVLWSTHGAEQGFGTRGGIHVSRREYLFWKTRSTTLEDFTAIVQDQVTLADGEYPERIQIQSFTPGHVTLNGGHFMLGRDFLPEEGMTGKEHVVVLSYQFWKRRHNSDTDVIGKSLRLNGVPYTIVGVLAPGWWDRRREPLWPALVVDAQQPGVDRHTLTVQATRRPGVTTAQAQSEMNAISTRMAERYPQLDGWGVRVDERRNSWLNDRTATNLWLLMGSVSGHRRPAFPVDGIRGWRGLGVAPAPHWAYPLRQGSRIHAPHLRRSRRRARTRGAASRPQAGEHHDRWPRLYSLGMVLHEMFRGKRWGESGSSLTEMSGIWTPLSRA